jgi:hypothetical protein
MSTLYLQILCTLDINFPVYQILLQNKKKGISSLYSVSRFFLLNFAINDQNLESINLIFPYNKTIMTLHEIIIPQCNSEAVAHTWLQLICIKYINYCSNLPFNMCGKMKKMGEREL